METALATPSPSGQYARIAIPLHTVVVLVAQAGLALRTMMRVGQMGDAASVDRVQLYERTMLFQLLMFGLVLIYSVMAPLITAVGTYKCVWYIRIYREERVNELC